MPPLLCCSFERHNFQPDIVIFGAAAAAAGSASAWSHALAMLEEVQAAQVQLHG